MKLKRNESITNIYILNVFAFFTSFLCPFVAGHILVAYQYLKFKQYGVFVQVLIGGMYVTVGLFASVFAYIFSKLTKYRGFYNLTLTRWSILFLITALCFELAGIFVSYAPLSVALFYLSAVFVGMHISLMFGILNLYSDSCSAPRLHCYQGIRFIFSKAGSLLANGLVVLVILALHLNSWDELTLKYMILFGLSCALFILPWTYLLEDRDMPRQEPHLSYYQLCCFDPEQKENQPGASEEPLSETRDDPYATLRNNDIPFYLTLNNFLSTAGDGWKMFLSIYFLQRGATFLAFQVYCMLLIVLNIVVWALFSVLLSAIGGCTHPRDSLILYVILTFKFISLAFFLCFVFVPGNINVSFVFLALSESISVASEPSEDTFIQNYTPKNARFSYVALNHSTMGMFLLSAFIFSLLLIEDSFELVFYISIGIQVLASLLMLPLLQHTYLNTSEREVVHM
jgi:MFS family permease